MRPVNSRPSVSFWALLVLAAAFAQPCLLFGQAVRGTIRDSSTNRVIQDVRLTLLDLFGDTMAAVVSDGEGTFLMGAPRWGRYILSSIRLGYRPVTLADLKLLPDDTLQLALSMSPLAFAMDPVLVQAEAAAQYAHARYLHMEGFFQRARTTAGRHLDPATIERRRPTALFVSDYLTHLPGVRFGSIGLRLRCGNPWYFIDDVRALDVRRLEDVILPDDVLAIEVYSGPAETPERYGGKCAILIWTRHRAEAKGRP